MNTLNMKSNYYALFLAIVKNKTAKQALVDMGICPESEMENHNEDT